MLRELWSALRFLTILPTPPVPYDPIAFSRSARWYPLAGLVLGGLLVAAQWAFGALLPPLPAAALLLALWVILTGGLHLDGLADCCDGLLAPVTAQRRLEILRDPRVGAFGAMGLGLALLLKFSLLAALLQPGHADAAEVGATAICLVGELCARPSAQPAVALILAPLWARWALLLAARGPQARPDGMGATFAAELTSTILGVALAGALLASVAALPLLPWAEIWRLPATVVAVHGVVWGMVRAARLRLGGVTGDLLGAVVELSEIAVLLLFVIAH